MDEYTPHLDQWANYVCRCGRILIGKPEQCPVCGQILRWEIVDHERD